MIQKDLQMLFIHNYPIPVFKLNNQNQHHIEDRSCEPINNSIYTHQMLILLLQEYIVAETYMIHKVKYKNIHISTPPHDCPVPDLSNLLASQLQMLLFILPYLICIDLIYRLWSKLPTINPNYQLYYIQILQMWGRLNLTKSQIVSIQNTINHNKQGSTALINSFLVYIHNAQQINRPTITFTVGLLQLQSHRHNNAKFMRIYSIDTLALLIQIQLSFEFTKYYRSVDSKTIIIIDSNNDVCFQYKNDYQALVMRDSIIESCQSLKKIQPIVTRQVQNNHQRPQINTCKSLLKEDQQSQQWSLLGFFKRCFSPKSKQLKSNKELTMTTQATQSDDFGSIRLSKLQQSTHHDYLKDVNMEQLLQSRISNQRKLIEEKRRNKISL